MTFQTPRPVLATIGLTVGELRLVASERDTTTVEVRPSDPSNQEDVTVAEKTRVECSGERLQVTTPRSRSWIGRGGGGSVEIAVELPAGSSVRFTGGMADVTCEGPLDDGWFKNGIGQIRVEQAEKLSVKSGAGDIEVGRVAGVAELGTGSGDVRAGELAGSAVVKNSNGDTWVGVAGSSLRLSGANGSLAVARAEADVVAKAANGDVRVGEIVAGTVVLETAVGDVEVGIPDGTAAYLDVSASAGRIDNLLEIGTAPDKSAPRVEVRARTALGNIVIRRPEEAR
jgi:hypothetical protein